LSRKAFSLVEMLVVCGLLAVLVTLMLSVIVPMINAGQRGADSSDIRQMGALTLELIAEDIEQSAAIGCTLNTTLAANCPLALTVHQVMAIAQDGKTIWAPTANTYLYNAEAGTISLYHCAPPFNGLTVTPNQVQPFRWVGGNFASYLAANPPVKLLATDVTACTATGFTTHGVVLPLQFTMTLSRMSAKIQQTVTVTQAVSPKVHGVQ
jgi:type II secretory pathway pseudopilin PulG